MEEDDDFIQIPKKQKHKPKQKQNAKNKKFDNRKNAKFEKNHNKFKKYKNNNKKFERQKTDTAQVKESHFETKVIDAKAFDYTKNAKIIVDEAVGKLPMIPNKENKGTKANNKTQTQQAHMKPPKSPIPKKLNINLGASQESSKNYSSPIDIDKERKKKLNTKAKVFYRSSCHEDSAKYNEVKSVDVSPLGKFRSEQQHNMFFSKDFMSSELSSLNGSEIGYEEIKIPETFSLLADNTNDFRMSSKSVQYSNASGSPIKRYERNVLSSAHSEAFQPTYNQNQLYNNDQDAYTPNNYWQQMHTQSMNFNNMLEMNCFQLLNEKFASLTGIKCQRPLFDAMPNQSRSAATNVPGSDASQFSQIPHHGLINNSESSENNGDDWYEESSFYDKFDEQIYNYVTEVENLIQSVAEERDILSKRIILNICKNAFPDQSVRVDVFGSLANGLALESSDMDLVVTGLKIEGREDVIKHIRILHQQFEANEYFTNIKPIESATIPVIKLEANLERIRMTENTKNTNKINPSMKYLQIDITFEDSKEYKTDSFWEGIEWHSSKLHLGMKSVHLVKSYIKEYVHLKELTLCIKKLLAVKGLNSPYQGGLSSYAVVIMIVAYMNFFSLQNAWVNISQLLMHFFDFYGTKFDENKVGILVSRGGCFYPFNSLSDCPIVIKDPLNIENNIGKNSYRIIDIKSEFSNGSKILENEKIKYLQLSKSQAQELESESEAIISENCVDKLLFLNKLYSTS